MIRLSLFIDGKKIFRCVFFMNVNGILQKITRSQGIQADLTYISNFILDANAGAMLNTVILNLLKVKNLNLIFDYNYVPNLSLMKEYIMNTKLNSLHISLRDCGFRSLVSMEEALTKTQLNEFSIDLRHTYIDDLSPIARGLINAKNLRKFTIFLNDNNSIKNFLPVEQILTYANLYSFSMDLSYRSEHTRLATSFLSLWKDRSEHTASFLATSFPLLWKGLYYTNIKFVKIDIDWNDMKLNEYKGIPESSKMLHLSIRIHEKVLWNSEDTTAYEVLKKSWCPTEVAFIGSYLRDRKFFDNYLTVIDKYDNDVLQEYDLLKDIPSKIAKELFSYVPKEAAIMIQDHHIKKSEKNIKNLDNLGNFAQYSITGLKVLQAYMEPSKYYIVRATISVMKTINSFVKKVTLIAPLIDLFDLSYNVYEGHYSTSAFLLMQSVGEILLFNFPKSEYTTSLHQFVLEHEKGIKYARNGMLALDLLYNVALTLSIYTTTYTKLHEDTVSNTHEKCSELSSDTLMSGELHHKEAEMEI